MDLRVWAPGHPRVTAVVDGHEHVLVRSADGVHGATVPGRAGSRYGFRLGDDEVVRPDPASHFQPDGTGGLSELIDPRHYRWRDADWVGRTADTHVLYEMHCGTFTPEGTWAAAAAELPRLARLGVTTIQLMPVNAYAGDYGWGYDGVFWFAPHHTHGHPDALRAFVDEAHASGLSVILDVVYNHLGPRDNVLPTYSPGFLSTRYENEWGDPINFDQEGASFVRRFVTDNAAYWIRDFHFDGLRLDATQQIYDASPTHILTDIGTAARRAAPHRRVLILGENEPQDARLFAPPAAGGCGVNLLYNDDFHHAARTRLTGWRDAYLSDYQGSAGEFVSCARHGFLFQGQHYRWQGQRRGRPALDIQSHRFLCFLENHDQVANTDPAGRRLSELTSPALLRALTGLLLLGPWTPLLFQGQEDGVTVPWVYFADHPGQLGEQVRQGRHEFVSQFRRLGASHGPASGRDPLARATFELCRLPRRPQDGDSPWWALHRDLLAWRRRFGGPAAPRTDASAPTPDLLLMRRAHHLHEYLIVVNLGSDVDIAPLADPLVAPPAEADWQLVWSSEHVDYGGSGAPALEKDRWTIAGHSAAVLSASVSSTMDAAPPDDISVQSGG